MRNKIKSYKHLFPTPLFFPGSTSLPFLSLLPPGGAGGWGMEVAVSSSHVVCAAPSSSGGGLLTLCPRSSVGSLPWRQSSMDCSSVSHSHRLQFSTNWSSMSPCHRVQSFKNRLLQCWRAESNFTTQRVIKQVCLLRCRVQGGSLLLTCTPSHEACTYLLQSLSK